MLTIKTFSDAIREFMKENGRIPRLLHSNYADASEILYIHKATPIHGHTENGHTIFESMIFPNLEIRFDRFEEGFSLE